MPTIGSLFSGIGGLDLGFERAGFETRWQVELDPYARAVLERHWPGVRRHDDVRTWPAADTERVDCIVGGFPCQPVSLAGKGLAQADPRWLWPEFRRVVARLRPSWVVIENVPGLRRRGLRGVLADLAALGFDAEWAVLAARDVGAPHLRKRIFVAAWDRERVQPHGAPGWLVANSHSPRLAQREGERGNACAQLTPSQRGGLAGPVADTDSGGLAGIWRAQRDRTQAGIENPLRDLALGHGSRPWSAEPNVRRVAHGIPARVDRLRCLGNAVVPQVAEVIARAIREAWRQ